VSKASALEHWKELAPGQDPLPVMVPIPYKAKGSRYGACGIRIDGNPAFIDAVLSNLKSLIDGENQITRLDFARSTVNGEGLDKSFPNADKDAESCYIRLNWRGAEGVHEQAFFGKHLKGATERFAKAQGIEDE
jgi:hypothetical protein